MDYTENENGEPFLHYLYYLRLFYLGGGFNVTIELFQLFIFFFAFTRSEIFFIQNYLYFFHFHYFHQRRNSKSHIPGRFPRKYINFLHCTIFLPQQLLFRQFSIYFRKVIIRFLFINVQ